jgi:molybdopterin-containing oxidoreductase family membrane subunit
MKENNTKNLYVLWAIAFIVGLIALIMKLVTGERLAGYGSYVPWGLWVGLYFHFIGIAGGAFAIGTIGYFLNFKGFREHIRVILLLSACSIVTGLFSIWLDLGQPFRFVRILYSPNFGSMMAFNAWMYLVFFAIITWIFYLTMNKTHQNDLHDKSGWLVPLLALGFVFSIAFPSQSGSFLGVVDAKPFWSSPLVPLLFLASAIICGAAAILLVFTFLSPAQTSVREQPFSMLRYIIIGGMVFYFIAEFAEFSLVFWSPHSEIRSSVELILFGHFWWVFWLIHLGGSFIALIMLVRGNSIKLLGTASFIVVVGFLSARLNILIPGQAVSELKGLKEAFYHFRLRYDYSPTLNEYLVAVFIGAFAVGLFYSAMKLLSKITTKRIGTPL